MNLRFLRPRILGYVATGIIVPAVIGYLCSSLIYNIPEESGGAYRFNEPRIQEIDPWMFETLYGDDD